MFRYLDALRSTGITNMFGAGPYLEETFGLPRKDAREVVVAWMKTYSTAKTVEHRAREALEVRGVTP